MKITNLPVLDITDCFTLKEIAIKLGLPLNGRSTKQVREYLTYNNIDSSHLDPNKNKYRKYKIISKECPVCNLVFSTREGAEDEKTTCSIGCANTYFRSGANHPNYKNGSGTYRSLVKLEKCNKCGYNEYPQILQVHHIDRDRTNNILTNLEVLCPNCHLVDHYLNNDGIFTSFGKK